MKTIYVELNASYEGCDNYSYGSEEVKKLHVSEEVYDALKKLDETEVSVENVVEAIEDGAKLLEPLHEKLTEAFYNIVERYWLFDADNECEQESLEESLEQDMEDGTFKPEWNFDSFVEKWMAGEIDTEDAFYEYEEYEGEEDDEDFEEEMETQYRTYLLNVYREWVFDEKQHNHKFIADRVGCDLNACREDEVDYTIKFEE